jgi:hypothetical protein
MGIKAVGLSGCLLFASLSLAADQEAQPSAETSKSLSYATYKETTGRVELVVGSQIAGLAEHEKYTPLQIAVSVNGKGPELEITPDRFQLIDAKGNIYNAVSASDTANEPGVLEYARQFNQQNPLVTGFDFATDVERVMSNFYPQVGGDFYVVSHLATDTFLDDLLFFPNPGDALGGVLTLQFLTPGMDAAVMLRFEVPIKNKKSKKKKKNLDKQKD